MLPVNATHQIALMGAMGREAIDLETLASRLPIPRSAIIAAAGRLVARGLFERLETGTYRLSPEGKTVLSEGRPLVGGSAGKSIKHPVYSDSLRQRAWKAMRLSGRFTAGEIAALAARGERDAEDSIRRYAHLLTRAGYLAELPTRARPGKAGSNGAKQWRLIRDTGEHAPQYMAAMRQIRDRNTGDTFPCK